MKLSPDHFITPHNIPTSALENSLKRLWKERIIDRIHLLDHTVWKPDPDEITNRLGWLLSPQVMLEREDEIRAFVDEVRAGGFTHALLLGMGGSSLAPEVFRQIFSVGQGFLELSVLDSTVPGAVLQMAQKMDPRKTIYISSTKSGGTIETLSFTKYFYRQLVKAVGRENAGDHFIAITDPKSGLEELARQLKFRKIFLNDPHIGGRYSALSFFGLVPAALIGIDIRMLLKRSLLMVDRCKQADVYPLRENPAALLSAMIGSSVVQGRDKLSFIIPERFASFGIWVEQLIAESTGKEGVGIVPVVGETLLSPDAYSQDRLFIYLKDDRDRSLSERVKKMIDHGFPVIEIAWRDPYELGAVFYLWEMMTAIAGYFLKINPFDQPDVESAKSMARDMMTSYQREGHLPEPEPSMERADIRIFTDEKVKDVREALFRFFAKRKERSYIAILAFIRPTPETDAALHMLRTKIQRKYRLATTVGHGPRFLHSTGQLHKGDSGNGLFIQLTGDPREDLPIPDDFDQDSSSIHFGILASSQALGDRQALMNASPARQIIRFHFKTDVISGIRTLVQALV